VPRKPFRVKRIAFGKPRYFFPFHFPALAACDTADFHLEEYPLPAAWQIPDKPELPIVNALVNGATTPAGRFFERRFRTMTRAVGSPNFPFTLACGTNPGNRYSSTNRLILTIGKSWRICRWDKTPSGLDNRGGYPSQTPLFTHSIRRRAILRFPEATL
jgi:hypothetical protein